MIGTIIGCILIGIVIGVAGALFFLKIKNLRDIKKASKELKELKLKAIKLEQEVNNDRPTEQGRDNPTTSEPVAESNKPSADSSTSGEQGRDELPAYRSIIRY